MRDISNVHVGRRFPTPVLRHQQVENYNRLMLVMQLLPSTNVDFSETRKICVNVFIPKLYLSPAALVDVQHLVLQQSLNWCFTRPWQLISFFNTQNKVYVNVSIRHKIFCLFHA